MPGHGWIATFASMLWAALAAIALFVGGIVQAIASAIEAATATSTVERIGPPRPAMTAYRVPVTDTARAGWNPTHPAYPATDIFLACGAELVSPISGIVSQVRTVDSWNPAVDDPATRGGRSIAIVGHDSVRYYLAHLDEVEPGLAVGEGIEIGERLGTMGGTGQASACHTHFGISTPCEGDEWAVRRGVVWPHSYLDAWLKGEQLNPVAEITESMPDNPNACAEAIATN
jgi:murein DD-endopeptidase MepM/ murein hydrolase activator NlpD